MTAKRGANSCNFKFLPVVLIQSERNPRFGFPRCEFYVKKPVTNVTNLLCTFPVLLTYSMVQSPAPTSVRHLSLSWASPIQSIYPHPTSWRYILILSNHLRLGLPSGLLPSGFPTKTLYTPSPYPYAPHAQPISFF